MGSCAGRGLVAAGCGLGVAAALLACGAFGEDVPGTDPPSGEASTEAQASNEASALDGALVDAATDVHLPDTEGPPCAVPVAMLSDDFSTAGLSPQWGASSVKSGLVSVSTPPPSAPSPASGMALRARVLTETAEEGSYAYANAKLPASNFRSLHLAYSILLPPTGFYGEVGCKLVTRLGTAAQLTGHRFGLSHEKTKAMMLTVDHIDQGVIDEEQIFFQRDVEAPARWYSVKLRVDLGATTATSTMTVRDHRSGDVKTVTFTDPARIKGFDTVELQCGISFANGAIGILEAAVDDVSLYACP